MKAIGDMSRQEVIQEIKETWPTLSNDDQARVLEWMDATAEEMRLPKGKLPGRATLSAIRSTKERQLPLRLPSSLP